jgi:hypothetical protein
VVAPRTSFQKVELGVEPLHAGSESRHAQNGSVHVQNDSVTAGDCHVLSPLPSPRQRTHRGW